MFQLFKLQYWCHLLECEIYARWGVCLPYKLLYWYHLEYASHWGMDICCMNESLMISFSPPLLFTSQWPNLSILILIIWFTFMSSFVYSSHSQILVVFWQTTAKPHLTQAPLLLFHLYLLLIYAQFQVYPTTKLTRLKCFWFKHKLIILEFKAFYSIILILSQSWELNWIQEIIEK